MFLTFTFRHSWLVLHAPAKISSPKASNGVRNLIARRKREEAPITTLLTSPPHLHLRSLAPPHNTTQKHVRLRPHPLRNSRARRSFRPPGPEGALRAAARPARCLLRLCWQVRWRCRRPRPPPRGVFRGVHCQVCRSCVLLCLRREWEGWKMQWLEGRWRR